MGSASTKSETKNCKMCGQQKPLDQFHNDRQNSDGKQSRCKQCQKRMTYEWRDKNPERVLEIQRKTSRKHAAKRRENHRVYYRDNTEKVKNLVRDRYHHLKSLAYAAYGGPVCACCGEDEPLFLTIDHVNNDGAAHRKVVPAASLYLWLNKNDYPPGFQVLCSNCNHGKRMNGGVCPHAAGRHHAEGSESLRGDAPPPQRPGAGAQVECVGGGQG